MRRCKTPDALIVDTPWRRIAESPMTSLRLASAAPAHKSLFG
ncbi:hypothetical protein [Tychonema sp. LEGE 06208]|nr:hypothetical protein [Tychonema sp. LEGE 06208]